MKNNISIGKTLANSFQFLIDNFDRKFKEGLPAVLIFTIIFYARSYLISNGIATNFTIIIFFIITLLVASTIGICVHEEILNKRKFYFFKEFMSFKSLKYTFNFLNISLIAFIPLILFFVKSSSLQPESILIFLIGTIFTMIFSLKLIFILPKLTLGLDYKYNIKELNSVGAQLFFLFTIITLIFAVPTLIYFTIQIQLMSFFKGNYYFLKPLMDIVFFYIYYFNYIVFFAVISYAYKEYSLK